MTTTDDGPRSELFMRVDIANILRAIDQAATFSDNVPEMAAWREGYRAALSAVATAFDVTLSPVELLPGGRVRWRG